MAQLNDSVVTGSLRVTNTLFTTTAQLDILNAATAANSAIRGPGSSGQLLISGGTSPAYWGTAVTVSSADTADTATNASMVNGVAFGSAATCAATDFAASSHTHTTASIDNFTTAVDDRITRDKILGTISTGASWTGNYAFTEGDATTASGLCAHAEGIGTIASSTAAHAEGYQTKASGRYSHAEGYNTTAASRFSHTEGDRTVTTYWDSAHAEGICTTADGSGAHVEGVRSIVTYTGDWGAHAEGGQTTASQEGAHAEGYMTCASGYEAHAEGCGTIASGNYTHAGGLFTIATVDNQTAIGKYNSTISDALFIIGNGTADDARSNAMYVTTSGSATFNSTVTAPYFAGIASNSEQLDGQPASSYASKTYVDDKVVNATHFKGGFDPADGTIDGGVETLTSVAEDIGDMYKATATGTYPAIDGVYFDIGDSLFFTSTVAALTDPTTADFTRVQNTVAVTNNGPTLAWNTVSTVGTVEGVNLTVKLPANPNSNTVSTLRGDYTYLKTGADVGVKRNSLIARDSEGYYQSFTSGSGTASSKAINRTTYFDISKIFYYGGTANVAENTNMSTATLYYAVANADLRYSLNIATTTLTARKPVYLIFDKTASTVGADGATCYKVAGTATNDWFTQTLPTSADGNIYVEIGKGVRDYRNDLTIHQTYYEYTDSLHGYDSISALEQNEKIPEILDIVITDNNGTLSCNKTFSEISLWLDQDGHYVDDIKARLSVVSADVIEYEAKNVWYNYNNTANMGYIYLYFDCGLVGITQYQGADNIQYINMANSLQLSHAEGIYTTASGSGSHTECVYTIASGSGSHAEGYYTTASGTYSHAEGTSAVASGPYSHAEGTSAVASSTAAHAEGTQTTASGKYAHAEGGGTIASGESSHAEGGGTTASNVYTHASGLYTIANVDCQTAIGRFNSTIADALFIVGKGTATNARSNAMYVTTAGNINCVSVTQTSDRRLKDNITNISTTDLAIYDKLQPKSFTLKSDDVKSKHYGFIAQDILQSFEELGLPSSYVGIIHQDQNEQGYYNINYTEFIALLVEKQKIMQQEIDELKTVVADLKQH